MAGTAVIIGLLAGVNAVWQVIVLLFAIGWLVTPLQAALTTIIQTETAAEVRGRVAALVSTTTTTASVVSMAIAGIFGDLLGVRSVFLLGAAVVGLAAVCAFVLFRGQHQQAKQAAAPVPVTDGPLPA